MNPTHEMISHMDVNACCPLCGSQNHKLVHTQTVVSGDFKHDFHVVVCRECGLIFVNPADETEIGKYYKHLDDVRGEMRSEIMCRWNVYLHCIGLIEKYNPIQEAKLLDVGAGVGVFLLIAKMLGYEVKGVEASVKAAACAKDSLCLDVTCSDGLNHLESANFNIVTLLDVLEHIIEPKRILGEIRRVLKDDGLLIIKVPNGRNQLIKTKLLGKLSPLNRLGVPEHVIHFSPATLKRMLADCGFEILEIKNGPVEDIPSPRAMQRIKRAMNLMMTTMANLLGVFIGPSIAVVARKRA